MKFLYSYEAVSKLADRARAVAKGVAMGIKL